MYLKRIICWLFHYVGGYCFIIRCIINMRTFELTLFLFHSVIFFYLSILAQSISDLFCWYRTRSPFCRPQIIFRYIFYQVCKCHHPMQGRALVRYTVFTALKVRLAAGRIAQRRRRWPECVCVCVCERERERERGEKLRTAVDWRLTHWPHLCISVSQLSVVLSGPWYFYLARRLALLTCITPITTGRKVKIKYLFSFVNNHSYLLLKKVSVRCLSTSAWATPPPNYICCSVISLYNVFWAWVRITHFSGCEAIDNRFLFEHLSFSVRSHMVLKWWCVQTSINFQKTNPFDRFTEIDFALICITKAQIKWVAMCWCITIIDVEYLNSTTYMVISPKNENSVSIYSPSCYSKLSMCLFVLLNTMEDIWKNVLIKQMMISFPIDYHSMYFFPLW